MSLDIQTLKALIAANRNRKAYEGFSHSIRLETYLLSNADAIVKELEVAKAGRELELAARPFHKIVRNSSGRIPTEKLSFADWHSLCKATTKMDETTK